MTVPKAVRKAAALGLLQIAPEKCPFPGRNGSPPCEAIIDVRAAASNVPLRSFLLGGLLDALSEFPPDAVIGGVSRGGLVLGSQLALVAGRPFVAVLPDGPRASGLERAVEGDVRERAVILFDNVVTSGTSLLHAARYVANAAGTVVGALAVGAYEVIPPLPFPLYVHVHFRELIYAAHESGVINIARRNRILQDHEANKM